MDANALMTTLPATQHLPLGQVKCRAPILQVGRAPILLLRQGLVRVGQYLNHELSLSAERIVITAVKGVIQAAIVDCTTWNFSHIWKTQWESRCQTPIHTRSPEGLVTNAFQPKAETIASPLQSQFAGLLVSYPKTSVHAKPSHSARVLDKRRKTRITN